VSYKLVGDDPSWRPTALLKTKVPNAFTPRRNISDVWNNTNPYFRPQDQLGPRVGANPNVAGLRTYNQNALKAIADANAETGQNYLARNSVYAPGAPNQLGGNQMANIHARVPIADGSMVSIPLMRAMNGYEGIATPEDLARRYRNAELIKGGFDWQQGLGMLAGAALSFPGVIGTQSVMGHLLGKLPGKLGTAAKYIGGAKTVADAVRTKGRNVPGLLLGGISPTRSAGNLLPGYTR